MKDTNLTGTKRKIINKLVDITKKKKKIPWYKTQKYRKTPNTELKSKNPKLQKAYDKYIDAKKEHIFYWDKYFGKNPLSQPYKYQGSNNPKDKQKALQLSKKRDKLYEEALKLEREVNIPK